MKYFVSLTPILLALFSAYAGAEEWPKLVSADNGATMYVKPGSAQMEPGKNGDMIFSVDAKSVSGESIVLMQLSVSIEDCIHEKGVMLTGEIGSSQAGELPFIFGSGTAASAAAEVMCAAAFKSLKDSGNPENLSAKPAD